MKQSLISSLRSSLNNVMGRKEKKKITDGERERERRGKSIIIAKYTTYLTFPSTLPYANASDPLVPLTVFIDLLPILL